MGVKITDFIGKGVSLLFNLPLYTNIKYDLEIETRDECEVLDYSEELGPTILHHTEYIEGKDFRLLKTIFLKKHNLYYYCPMCKRDTHIISTNLKEITDIATDDVLTSGTNISSEEENEAYEQFAKEELNSRAKIFFEKVFGETNVTQLTFYCTSKHQHKMYVMFHLREDGCIIKTGQYPSIMDFEKYNSLDDIFGKDKQSKRDFKTATILKTYNYGVGSYLYLRRIFERLIFNKIEVAVINGLMRKEDVEKKDIKEKIKELHKLGLVSDYLNENKTFIYGILSKGIHQLSENECLTNYDLLRESIALILRENSELEQREQKKVETKKTLNLIHTEMKKV